MTKKLPTTNIANELAGASAFFQSTPPTKPELYASVREDQSAPITQDVEAKPLSNLSTNQPSNRDSTLSRNHAITHARQQEGKQPITHAG